MRRIWKGFKLIVGLLFAAPLGVIGAVAYAIDQGCDALIDAIAEWAKR